MENKEPTLGEIAFRQVAAESGYFSSEEGNNLTDAVIKRYDAKIKEAVILERTRLMEACLGRLDNENTIEAKTEEAKKQERERILQYLKGLLKTIPKASLAATIDLIETLKSEREEIIENKDFLRTEIAEIFREAYWFARQHPKQKNTLNIGKLTKQQADLVLSKVLKAGYLRVKPSQCAYCGKAPDGAMLTMGNLMAHVPCVILKLNELLDPNYEGFGPADEIVGFLSKYVI